MEETRIREIVREELSNFNPQKKKRAPSKWQLFLKDCTKRQSDELIYTDKVKLCSIEYKEVKNNGGGQIQTENNNKTINQSQTSDNQQATN
jgi:hypothetical protein